MYQPMTLPDLLFAAADRAGYVNGSGKLKRKELADVLGIGEQALNSYMKGSRDVSTEQLNNMLTLFGVYGIAPFKGNQWMALDVDYKARSDAIVGEPVKQQKAAGGRPARFKVEQLEQWLKEQGGYKGTIDELALHAFGKVGKDGKLHGAPGRHWMYKALAKLEDEGKIAKEAATRSGINIVA